MNNSLDFENEHFGQLLQRGNEMVLNQFEGLEKKAAYHAFSQKEVEKWFDETLPRKGMNISALLDEVQTKVMDTATNNLGPHMYAYVMAGGTQVSILAKI